MDNDVCETCPFWFRVGGDEGECIYHLPVMGPDGTEWIRTDAGQRFDCHPGREMRSERTV